MYGHKLVVFPIATNSHFSVLQSVVHTEWVHSYGSSLETRPVYTPSDCFETFPFPESFAGLESVGQRYYTCRQSIMQSRFEGLTKTYNRFHDPLEKGLDIFELRSLHLEMDNAVAAAYHWNNFDFGHAFRETKHGMRYTISEAARREVLDRLLTLNHQRHAEEESEEAAAFNSLSRSARKQKRKPEKDSMDPASSLFV
ncbi:hypothetical protein RBB76_22285 [Tunturiibacter psychrotolerans]